MEQTLKYVWVIKALYNAGKRGISLAELSNRWSQDVVYSRGEPLPRQTFVRWKNDIEEVFGLRIECDCHGGYRYYIENPEVLTDGSLGAWLLDTIATTNTLSRCMALKERILVEDVPSGHQNLDTIIDAMQSGNVLRIKHHGFHKAEPSTSLVEPYCVKMHQRRWYMLGHVVGTNRLFIYGVDRIISAELTADTFKMPKDFDAREFFSTFYGVIIGADCSAQRVVLRADELQKHYLRSLPLHHSQREICDYGDDADFELFLRPTYDFCMTLLGYSNSVEVLEPQWLRNKIKMWAKMTVEMYTTE